MGFRPETLRRHPAPGQTLEGGLPSLPNRPRTPHVPHARALAMGAVFILAAGAASAKIKEASDTFTELNSQPRTNLIPAEQMRYPLGKQLLEITLSAPGEISIQTTTIPQAIGPDKFDHENLGWIRTDINKPDAEQEVVLIPVSSLAEAVLIPVLGASFEDQDPDNPFANITVNSDGLHGGAYFRIEKEGKPLLDPDGNELFTRVTESNMPTIEPIQEPVKTVA